MSIPDRPLSLNCIECADFTEFTRTSEDREVVRCTVCGEEYPSGRLMPIDPHSDYPRGPDGELIEEDPT